MATVRQRKRVSASEPGHQAPHTEKHAKQHVKGHSGTTASWILTQIILTTPALGLGLVTTFYVATLHENDLWFSSIKEVEREISFRTECGLYYSYYKQMLQAPSITQGITDLMYDNRTESMRTINILARMNVYQEVFLAVLYKSVPFWKYLEPVYFYIYALFGLQSVYVMALYVTSWLLSGTWVSGLLAALWYIVNRIDTTRVEFTIPLRENWALPFFAVQIAGITCFLKPNLTLCMERLSLLVVFVSTLLFSLTWQFNQFILLIQAIGLFILDCLDLVPTTKVTHLYLIQILSLLLVCVLQFVNTMILGSLILSFITAALIIKKVQKGLKHGHLLKRIWNLGFHVILVLGLTVLINKAVKKILHLQADEHIFKFIRAKLGFGSRDFDASLYLCEEPFRLLPFDTFQRLSDTLMLYPYVLALFILTIAATITVFHNLSSSNAKRNEKKDKKPYFLKPEIAYNLIHALLFGCLGLSTMRMKYLWTSHMCSFSSFGLLSVEVWGLVLKCFKVYTPHRTNVLRYSVSILLILCLIFKFWPRMTEELSELREFHDPDTVQLMNWIKSNTPKNAAFAGSMQLLAGVKLCTGRIITNHPHYEDKSLRDRTKQVYQVYAKRSPEDVHSILRSFGTDYMILEDSICYERRHGRGCRLRDLLDVDNGHIMDGPGENDPDLKPSLSPRFCEEIKRDLNSYTSYFTRVFKNKTFNVYRLAKTSGVK
uniref:Dpy-19 like C-mannosyltransferase 3 n=1 Tax=Leptobrachium leishanense TaxID=445787 RepID=A0A8C5PU64_9ANUR